MRAKLKGQMEEEMSGVVKANRRRLRWTYCD